MKTIRGTAALALGACGITALTGIAAAVEYTSHENFLRSMGLTLQHLRPIHESFATAWMFLGGVTLIYLYLFETFGEPCPATRRRMLAHNICWALAGIGIFVSLLGGHFTGREYAGWHPAFSVLILAGWILFAWNYYSLMGLRLQGRPAFVYMWTLAIPLFAITFLEGHLYLIDEISRRPLRDIAIQWKSLGPLVGVFNQLIYGGMMVLGCRLKGSEEYAHSKTAFGLFWIGILNTFTNFGHHTFHLPQTPLVHWVSFIVSMLEVIILAKLLIDLPRNSNAVSPEFRCAKSFLRSAQLWIAAMLTLAIVISIPPLNALIHGTHVVVAHSMGAMIGIDSMILWAGMAYLIATTRVRGAIVPLNAFLLLFWVAFLTQGMAVGAARYMGPGAPDVSVVTQNFPVVMILAGSGVGLCILWIVGNWLSALWSAPLQVTCEQHRNPR
jgi:nitric oxide reductase subunit B